MKILNLSLGIILFSYSFISIVAQEKYTISPCNLPASNKFVGDRLILVLPKHSIVKKGQDVDYSNYFVGFGKKNNRVWLSGIFGPTATSGHVSDKQLSSSKNVLQKTWKFGEIEGTDTKGELPNGNFWRYFGQYGESIEYYDVSAEAAAYFDNLIDKVCYNEWK